MAEPTAQQVHIDSALTNIAIRYSNDSYIADRIFPNVQVAKQTDKFFTFAREDWFRDDAGPRAPGTRAPRVDYNLSTDNYVCVSTAAAKQVPIEVVQNADSPLQPLVDATNFVSEKYLIAKEIDVFADVFGSGWASSATPSPTWDDDASDMFGDIETAVNTVEQAIGRQANIGVIGRGLWRYVKFHPDAIDKLKGGATPNDPARLFTAALEALTEIPTILIARGVKQTAEEGETASYSYIGGNHMFVGYVTSNASIQEPSAGYIFNWMQPAVSRFDEDQEKATVVEIEGFFDVKVTSSVAGYLIKSGA